MKTMLCFYPQNGSSIIHTYVFVVGFALTNMAAVLTYGPADNEESR